MARRQKQLNPIVTVGNKTTKAVRSDKAEFRTGKTRPQPIPQPRCERNPDSLMLDTKRLQASSRRDNSFHDFYPVEAH